MLDLTVIILTKDEQLHIKRCLECVNQLARKIYVVDCFSTDRTQEIARSLGAEVVEKQWPGNQAALFNWALEHLYIDTEWVLRLDADEYLLPELIEELQNKIPLLTQDVTGIVFNRRHIFMGRWMKRGIYPVKMLRMFRKGKAVCEQRLMDEHLRITEGRTEEYENDFCDHNLNDISWFCRKHVNYAIREAAEMLDLEYNLSDFSSEGTTNGLSEQTLEKRQKKLKYASQPLFLRSFAYFLYRYIIRGAWREGKEGFIFTFIQGWWYRTLVDANIYEIKKECGMDKEKICNLLADKYQISIRKR